MVLLFLLRHIVGMAQDPASGVHAALHTTGTSLHAWYTLATSHILVSPSNGHGSLAAGPRKH